MKTTFRCYAAVLVLLCWCITARAVEIRGTVRSATANSVTIGIEGESTPSVGDPVEIFFKMPGVDEEISVGTGKVTAVAGDSVEANIDKATGTVSKDQLAKIISEKPAKKGTTAAVPAMPVATTQSASAPAPAKPNEPTESPPNLAGHGPRIRTFDNYISGTALPPDALEFTAGRIAASKGKPMIDTPGPEMVLPAGRERVMLIHGDRETSLTLTFDPPLKRFSLTRVGVIKGASVPAWRLESFDAAGNELESISEEHGLYEQPRTVSLERGAISRVRLLTDNRFGAGTWATYNGLPIAEIEMER
jgi:hypothetical protein